MESNEMNPRAWGFTPYESFLVADKTSRRASGTAIAGVTVASVAAALAVGSWIFGPIFANSKANGVAALAAANQRNTDATIDRLTNLLAAERAERVAGDVNLTNTVNDSVSGSQQGSLTAQQAAELSAVNSVMQQTFADAITGRSEMSPQKVSLYSAPQPCACPGCGA